MELLHVAVIAEGVALLSSVGAIFLHAITMKVRRQRALPLLERGRQVLAALALRPRVDRADVTMLKGMPRRLQVRLFAELAPSVAGSHRRYLGALAAEIGLVAAAEELCRSRRWWRRLHGVRLLTTLGRGRGVVPELFRDPDPAVRAEAVEWAGGHPEPAVIARLMDLLATPALVGSWVIRDSLLRIGPPAIPPLAAYLETHSGHAAEAALEVAAGLADPRFAAAALRLCGDPLPRVRARAATLAGAIGGDEVVQALTALLDDTDAVVRAAAAAALGRQGHWPAATRISTLLRDPAWVVRSQAALALRRMGSPGQLLLRRTLADHDRFAADIARQVLDMPGSTAERDQWR